MPRSVDARIAVALTILVAAVLLLLQQGTITNSDGQSSFALARSLVEDGDTTVPPSLGVPGDDGRYYSLYGIGLAALETVPYVLVTPVAGRFGNAGFVHEFAVASLFPVAAALLVGFLYLLCCRLGGTRRRAVLVSTGAVFGTYYLPYAKDSVTDTVAVLFIVIAVERLAAGAPGPAAVALAAAILTRPQAAVAAPFFLWALWRARRRINVALVATPLVLAGLVLLAYNHARFGNPADFGYPTTTGRFRSSGVRVDYLGAARAFLVDPQKSILLFAPVVVLLPFALARLWRTQRTVAIVLAGNLLATFVVVGGWAGAGGGPAWGPRYLLLGVIPAVAAVAPWLTTRERTAVAAALFVLGFCVSAATLVVSTQAQQLDGSYESGVVRQIELVPPTVRYTRAHLSEPSDRGIGEHRRFLTLWQVGVIRELGRRGLIPAVIGSIALLAIAFVAGRWLLRLLRTSSTVPQRLFAPGP
jgi:hypothetical protein